MKKKKGDMIQKKKRKKKKGDMIQKTKKKKQTKGGMIQKIK